MKYAILDENNKVINIAKSETALHDNWIDGTGAKIGDTWDGEKFVSPPKYSSLSEAHKGMCAQIEADRIARTQYMPWTVPSSGTQVQVKIAEEPPGKPRQTWLSGTCSWGLACVQEGTPDEVDDLIAADDSLHSMTAQEWVQFGKALKVWVRDNLMAAKQHIANVQALDTVQDVIDYDFSTGWPS
jgi:hypothetical protein